MAGGSTARREGMWPAWLSCGLAGVDAGHTPQKDSRLSFLARVQHVVQTGRELRSLRPTDRAMAARSVRTSSSEEESRLSDDEERLLTKRSMATRPWER